MKPTLKETEIQIGVGLRHPHYSDVLAAPAPIDFVEIHSENFFARGGATRQLLKEVAKHYQVSLHSTAMGLGSASEIPQGYLDPMQELAAEIKPFLISDHAAFAWSEFNGFPVHAGDLLPVAFNRESLQLMADNVDRIQQLLGRQLLVENASAYIIPTGSVMEETEFLVRLTELTGCALLVDINNIVVNAKNFSNQDPLDYGLNWLRDLPGNSVGEFHLAGFTPVADGELIVDDHSQPVSDLVWQLYQTALKRFGPVPTLVEWDHELPSWDVLIAEAVKARHIANKVFTHG